MARTFTYPSPPPATELQVRAARFDDLLLIQDIHNQGIIDRVATLDTELRSMAETQLWFKRHGPRHPVLVAETSGSVAGWASLNTFNVRPAYQYVADLSIYLARPWRGKGLGARLLAPLIALARELGYHKIVLSAFPTNTAGLRLYERHGFTVVGIYKEMGLLDGRWVDTILMEKLL
jgi:phosphinothricin acetyltransferase